MAIYRGPGGAGDATNDATSQSILAAASAAQAAASAAAASASASQAATSATNSASSATSSANSATAAASSANSASTSATNAANSATAAQTAQTAAELAETNAETAEANAETAEANATASAALAQDWATKTSGPVAGGEYSSKYNAQLAATSATNASNSATSASTSASAASTSATNAASSATAAASSASAASTSATNAANSATAAASSATSAASSASTTTTQASNAASSASAAATSASNAATSATNAANSATAAASSATSAAASAIDAQSSEDAAAAYASSINPANFLAKANNLSDLSNTSTARTNLGLGTAATMTGPTSTIVGTTDTQTLTNKTLTSPIINGTGVTFNDGSSQQTAATGFGFKNRIINGAFNIWQRGTSSSVSGYQTADRWVQQVAGTTTFTRETSVVPAGFRESLKWTAGAASSYGQVRQWIETANLYDLRGQVVTVSALVRCNSTYIGAAIFEVGYSSTSELSSASYSVVSFTNQTGAVTSSGYTQITATFTVPSNTVGLYVGIVPDTAQNSGAILYMAGVQLEKGSTATSFDYRPYGTELALCQRYYYSSYSNGVAINGADTISGHHQAIGVDVDSAILQNGTLAVPMRATPTCNIYTAAGGAGSGSMRNHSTGGTTITGVSIAGVNNRGLGYVSKIGSLALGVFYGFEMTADAEL